MQSTRKVIRNGSQSSSLRVHVLGFPKLDLVHEIGEDASTTLHRLDLEGVAMSLEFGGLDSVEGTTRDRGTNGIVRMGPGAL